MNAEVIYTPQLHLGPSRIGPEGDQAKHKTGQEHKPFPRVGRSRAGGTGQKLGLTGGWQPAETSGRLVGSTVLLCSPGTLFS